MTKLEGIIYKAFDNFVVFRGYAPIDVLAIVSKKPDAYQRVPNDEHKRDIIRFLDKGEYTYFPELVLAYRGDKLKELISSIQSQDDIDFEAEQYVKGLKVLKERVPYSGYRARHAQLDIDTGVLMRVDGNHRLEPFTSDNDWWWYFVQEKEPDGYSELELNQWKNQKIKGFRDRIGEIIVPFSIVISDIETANKFEASIFNNINFKQLPLKQEKNIQNIYNFLKDSEELGVAHALTMTLIDLVEKEHFKGLEYLTKKGNDDDVFRTACFKIANILIEKKRKIQGKEIVEINDEIEKIRKKMNELDNNLTIQKDSKEKKVSGGRKLPKAELDKLDKNIENIENDIVAKMRLTEKYKIKLGRLENFEKKAENVDAIEIAIQSLRTIYAKMDKDIGNLSLLTTLVYYKLLDESKFNSFVDWILRNGINKIPVNDELPTHDANSLVDLFERVYEAKRKEIFISMHFRDSQSEMIYEKVIQTIEKFNRNKGYDISIIPIRVDQTIKPSAFTIPEEILRAIENSSLIIADLSSGNINVYHEVGYATGIAKAKGIEPPVILLYKTDTESNKDNDIDKFIGFNLRSTSQLRFTTYKELTDELTKRLEVYFEI